MNESVYKARLETLAIRAYAVTQASEERGQDTAYEACHSAAKSAVALANRSEKQLGQVTVVLPAVVIDGQLFTAQLNPDGDDVEVVEVDQVQLLWRYPHVGDWPTIVSLVTEKALSDFVTDFVTLAETLLAHVDEARRALSDSLRF